MSEQTDSAFSGFRFHRVLGSVDGVGVYGATEQETGRPVVIETLLGDAAGDEDLREWFRWAWEEVRELDHPGTVRVLEVGEREGVPFAVREPIGGEDLAGLVESAGSLTTEVADAILHRLAEVLAALHEAGIVHGALTAECVLLDGEDDGATAEAPALHLTGFGRTEGHRRDDVQALARIHAAVLGEKEAATEPLAAVLERAEGGGYRTADALSGAVAQARRGIAPGEEEEADGQVAGPPAEAGPDRSLRTARRGFWLAALAAVAAVVVVLLITSGDEEGSGGRPGPTDAAEVTPEDPPPAPGVSVTGEGGESGGGEDPPGVQVEVEGGPSGISVRDGVVYVVTADSGELVGFDERTGEEIVGPIDLGSGAGEVTIVDDVAWATLPGRDQVARVDLAAGDPGAKRIGVGERPNGVIGAAGSIFVAETDSGGLSRVDPADDTVESLIVGAEEPRGIAFGAGALWVSDGGGQVLRVDPDDPASSEGFPTGAAPRGVLVVGTDVWIANSGDGTVTRLESGSGESESIDVGGAPVDLAADEEGRIWVANADGYASSIAIASGDVERVEVPAGEGAPVGIAAGSSIWVSTGDGDTVVAID